MTIPPCSRLCTACARRTGSSYSPQITHCPKCGPLVGGKEFHSFGVAAGFAMWTPEGSPSNTRYVHPASLIAWETDSVFDSSPPRRKYAAAPATAASTSTAAAMTQRPRRSRWSFRVFGACTRRGGTGVRAFLAKAAAMVSARLRPTGSLPFVGRDPGLVRTRTPRRLRRSLARAARAPPDGGVDDRARAAIGRGEADRGGPGPRRPRAAVLGALGRRAPGEQQRLPPARGVEAPGLRRPPEGVAREGRRPRSLARAGSAAGLRRAQAGARCAPRRAGEAARRDGEPRRGPSHAARPRALGRDAAETRRRGRGNARALRLRVAGVGSRQRGCSAPPGSDREAPRRQERRRGREGAARRLPRRVRGRG